MIRKCTKCKNGDIDFTMSELIPIDGTNPQQAEIEGICIECGSHYTFKFKEFEYEVIEFDDFMEEVSKDIIKI